MLSIAKSRLINFSLIACLLFAPALAWGDQTYTNVTVPAAAEISGAGNAGLPDPSGVAPIMETLPAGAAVLTFSSVTGIITLDSGNGYNDPDGTVVQGNYGVPDEPKSEMDAYGGISGITGPSAGYLVGVFTTGVAPTGPAPPSLDFVATDPGGINTNFTTLSPQLYQVFYIGDGLTGDGSGTQQQFIVPAGATTLYLGISDTPGPSGPPGAYSDNSGSFTVTAVATAPVPVITSPATASGTALAAFSYQITADNQPTSFGALDLPAGLTLDASTGLISGMLGSAAGTSQVTLSATNAAGTGTAVLTLTVDAAPANPPVITSPTSGKGQVGQAFKYQIAASNTPASYSAAGLPPGLNADATTGLISGTPTQAGTFNVTLSAANSGGAGMAMLNLIIAPPLPVVSLAATAPEVTLGSGEAGVFTVSLSAAQTTQLSVAYTVKGTAIDGVDYVMLTGKKKFKPGIASKKINIQPLGDLEGAAKKTVKLTLSAGRGYTLGATTSAKVKILAGP